jgi:hypothetical protein
MVGSEFHTMVTINKGKSAISPADNFSGGSDDNPSKRFDVIRAVGQIMQHAW